MKRLLILSGKGGTGKTTTAAAFVDFSGTRAFGDCDVDAPNLHLVAGIREEPERKAFIGSERAQVNEKLCIGCGLCESKCRFGAIRVEQGTARVQEYACEGCGVCAYVCPEQAVRLVPDVAGEQFIFRGERVFSTAKLKMGRGNSGKLVTGVKKDLLKHAPETELCIVDGSPGIGCPVIASVSGMDLVLVVAEPSLSGLSDLKRLMETARTFETPVAVCVNKWDVSPAGTEKISNFCGESNIPFLGKIPYDKKASQAINQGQSLAFTDCPASQALRHIYEEVKKLLEIS